MRYKLLATLVVALLVGPAGFPSVGAQGESKWAFADPAGDVQVFWATIFTELPGVGVGTSLTDPFDIVSVGVKDEDEADLVLSMAVADMWTPASAVVLDTERLFSISFSVEGLPYRYNVESYVVPANFMQVDEPEGTYPLIGDFCAMDTEGRCHWQNATFWIDLEDDSFNVRIPKAGLLGLEPAYDGVLPLAGAPSSLPAGSRLTGWFARTQGIHFVDGASSDESYVTQWAAANTQISVALTNPQPTYYAYYYGGFNPYGNFEISDPNRVAVPGQGSLQVDLEVYNRETTRRLVSLEATSDDSRIELTLTPSLEVPSKGSATVSLQVNITGTVSHRELIPVHVAGESLGREDESAFFTFHLEGVVPPSPSHKELYFHGVYEESIPGPTTFFSGYPRLWLNTLEDDPEEDADMVVGQTGFSLYGPTEVGLLYYGVALDTSLSEGLVLDTATPAKIELSFSNRVPMVVDVYAALVDNGGELAQVAESVAVGMSPTRVELLAPVNPAEARVPAQGNTIEVYFEVRSTDPAGSTGSFDGFQWQVSQSKVVLPVVDTFKDLGKAGSEGDVRVGLTIDEDDEEFINPNETRVFPLTLTNQHEKADRFQVNVTVTDEGWRAWVEPAERYDLDTGQSVQVDVLVMAPDDVQEGQTVPVIVEAISVNDPSVKRTANLTVIATTNVDVEDEAEGYAPDEEAAARAAAEEGGQSPGVGLLAVLVAIGAGVTARRSVRGRAPKG